MFQLIEPDIKIIPLKIWMARRIAAIHCQSFALDSWSYETFKDLLDNHHVSGWLIVNCHVAGFLMIRCIEGEAEILTFAISPKWQRHRLGTALLKTLREWAQKNSVEAVFLEVAIDNVAALRLYHSQGFTSVGRRRDYYTYKDGSCVDAELMVLRFLASPTGFEPVLPP